MGFQPRNPSLDPAAPGLERGGARNHFTRHPAAQGADWLDAGRRRCYISQARASEASGNNSAVECDLAKVEVAGSNPVSRSILSGGLRDPPSRFYNRLLRREDPPTPPGRCAGVNPAPRPCQAPSRHGDPPTHFVRALPRRLGDLLTPPGAARVDGTCRMASNMSGRAMRVGFLVNGFPYMTQPFINNPIRDMIARGHEVTVFARWRAEQARQDRRAIESGMLERTVFLREFHCRSPLGLLRSLGTCLCYVVRCLARYPGLALRAINPFAFASDGILLRVLRVAEALRGREPDVLVCHWGDNGNLGAALRSLGFRFKLVVVFHGYDIETGLELGGKKYERLFRLADRIIAVSDYNARCLARMGAPMEKVSVLPFVGVDLSSYARGPVRKRGERDVVLITVSRLEPHKDLETSVAAFRLAHANSRHPMRYVIVGTGSSASELRAWVDKHELSEWVSFVGIVAEDVKRQLLESSDIFVMPSTYEALCVALIEASAMELPIVATRAGGIPEVVVEGTTGFLVPPGSPEQMAERLLRLVDDPPLRSKMGRAGRRHIESSFNPKELGDRLEGLIAGQPGERPHPSDWTDECRQKSSTWPRQALAPKGARVDTPSPDQ